MTALADVSPGFIMDPGRGCQELLYHDGFRATMGVAIVNWQ